MTMVQYYKCQLHSKDSYNERSTVLLVAAKTPTISLVTCTIHDKAPQVQRPAKHELVLQT
jgi:hypothetical protein